MNTVIKFAIFATFCFTSPFAQSNDDLLLGLWKAKDNLGTVSIIEFYAVGEKINGRIVNIIDSNGVQIDPLCERCAGELKNQRVRSLTFINGLSKSNGKWTGGSVIDIRPGLFQGVVARCEIEVKGNKAILFGFLKYRWISGSSVWDRVNSPNSIPN